jgi:DNA-binding NarL/FixJ family response regulator
LRSTLRRMGFRHILCGAREVIQHLGTVRTDLLITRHDRPDLDAWRLTRMIRSGRFCSAALPIVVSEERPQPVLEAIAREHDGLVLYSASHKQARQRQRSLSTWCCAVAFR